jgi:hypothetical protein
VQRLNTSLRQPPALLGALQREIEQLRLVLAEAGKTMLAKPAPSPGGDAQLATPQAIIKASEELHELAWSLQANDVNPEGCESIARNASRIYALSQAQAVEGARARQFSDALDQAAKRLSALLETIGHEMLVDGAQTA